MSYVADSMASALVIPDQQHINHLIEKNGHDCCTLSMEISPCIATTSDITSRLTSLKSPCYPLSRELTATSVVPSEVLVYSSMLFNILLTNMACRVCQLEKKEHDETKHTSPVIMLWHDITVYNTENNGIQYGAAHNNKPVLQSICIITGLHKTSFYIS